VIYNKEVQTTEVATDPIVIPVDNVVQQRISREQLEAETAAARDKELEAETVQLEKEIEEEIRGETTSLTGVFLTYSL
jgi:dynein cytoplasmic 1 intermediate chain